jgi:hypothetical protein
MRAILFYMRLHTIYEMRDPVTGDGLHAQTDETGRLELTLELDGRPPRTLVLTNRAAARALGTALLRATDDLTHGGPDAVTLEVGP